MDRTCEIRALHESDAVSYRDLRLFAHDESSEAFGTSLEEEQALSAEQFAARLTANAEESVTLGLFVDGSLGGTVSIVRMSRVKMRHKAGLYGMYLRPELRGRGWGRRLFEEAIAAGRRMKGVEILQLSVVVDQAAARTLYHHLGFIPYGMESRALRNGDRDLDEELLALEISKRKS